MIELIYFMMQHFLPGVSLNMLFGHIYTPKLIILSILSKFYLSTRALNSLTYPVYLKINLLSHLFLLILKIRNPLSFVISIINLFLVLFLHVPGRVAQSVTCLATDACLTADLGVASSIPARSHTFVEIDHEIISTVILLPSADSFKKGCCQLQAKVCAQITG